MRCGICGVEWPRYQLMSVGFVDNEMRKHVCVPCLYFYCQAILDGTEPREDAVCLNTYTLHANGDKACWFFAPNEVPTND